MCHGLDLPHLVLSNQDCQLMEIIMTTSDAFSNSWCRMDTESGSHSTRLRLVSIFDFPHNDFHSVNFVCRFVLKFNSPKSNGTLPLGHKKYLLYKGISL